MVIFFIAIIISIVLRFLSGIVVRFYISLNKSKDDLDKSFIFNLSALVYVLNTGLIFINSSILFAIIIKTYLL
jgi:hypothetical protein